MGGLKLWELYWKNLYLINWGSVITLIMMFKKAWRWNPLCSWIYNYTVDINNACIDIHIDLKIDSYQLIWGEKYAGITGRFCGNCSKEWLKSWV